MDKICIVTANIQSHKDVMGSHIFDIIGIYRVPTARFCQKILDSIGSILDNYRCSGETFIVNQKYNELAFIEKYVELSYDCDDTNEVESISYNCSDLVRIEGTDEELHGDILVSIVPLSKIYNYRFKYNIIPYSEYFSNISNEGIPEYSNVENMHFM